MILIIGTLVILVGLGFLLFIRRLRQDAPLETSYRTLFNMGLIFIGAGLAISASMQVLNPLFILGLIYFGIGLVNKDKWKPKVHEQ
jgi:hypothetical protein